MQINIEQFDTQRAVFRVRGRIDSYSADQLKQEFKNMADKGIIYIIVSLREVPVIDSSGLGALVSGYRMMRERNGNLVIAEVGSEIRVALELTRLDQVLPIYDDLASARASISS